MNALVRGKAKPNFALCAIGATDTDDSHSQNLDKLAHAASRRHLLWMGEFYGVHWQAVSSHRNHHHDPR